MIIGSPSMIVILIFILEFQIRIEVVAKVTRLSPIPVGGKFWFSASVRSNLSPIWVGQLPITMVTQDSFEETDYNEVS